MVELLTGVIRNYDWGSKSLIAELQGRGVPSTKPEAEIWYGAHLSDPSLVSSLPLNEIINEDPIASLGPRVSAKYANKLPFLLKILAAGSPLSLQAHPSLEQAREGFARENFNGIELHAPNRNFRDDNHKPELVVALTEFVAMAGFRPLSQTLELFDALHCDSLEKYRHMFNSNDEEGSIKELFDCWIQLEPEARDSLIGSIVESAHFYLAKGDNSQIKFILENILCLHKQYPHDAGVLISLLLNFYKLSPGEGIYLDAGHLHAYISGLAVEIMANSDNVLRGGLTSKHVDVPELVKVLKFEPLEDARVQIHGGVEVRTYPVPVSEFKLDRVSINGTYCAEKDGPMIILCTRGEVQLSCGQRKLTLAPTDAAWASAADGAVILKCVNAEVFIAYA